MINNLKNISIRAFFVPLKEIEETWLRGTMLRNRTSYFSQNHPVIDWHLHIKPPCFRQWTWSIESLSFFHSHWVGFLIAPWVGLIISPLTCLHLFILKRVC